MGDLESAPWIFCLLFHQ